jgi:hypothetical protein
MFDIRDLHDPTTGDILPMKDWPPEAASCVIGIEYVMKNATAGDGAVDRILKIRTINPVEAWKLEYGRLGLMDGDSGEAAPDVPAFIVSEKVQIVNVRTPAVERERQRAQP